MPTAALDSTPDAMTFTSFTSSSMQWNGTTTWTNPNTGTVHTGVPTRMIVTVTAGGLIFVSPPPGAPAVVGALEIYLPLDDLINLDEERARLAREVAKMEDEIARVQKKLSNGDFVAKAKEEVIQKERDKAAQFDEKLRTLRSSLAKIQDLQAGRL